MYIELAAAGLRSLAWSGDALIDWIGGQRITLDGNAQPFGVGDSYRFDATVGLGELGVAHEQFGTKGRIMRWNGELPEAGIIPLGYDELREIDRSYHEAARTAYPVCLLTLPDGRAAIAHCPRRYDTLELELLDGKALTRRRKKPDDLVHARLSASGRWLLANGRAWQSTRVACVYDLALALEEPAHLSTSGLPLDLGSAFDGDVDAAALSGDRLIATAGADAPALAVVELPSGKNLASIPLPRYAGTRILAWGAEHVVALDGSPCVISLSDGKVVHRWSEVLTGVGRTSPVAPASSAGLPLVAIDPARPRFAVASSDKVVVIAREP